MAKKNAKTGPRPKLYKLDVDWTDAIGQSFKAKPVPVKNRKKTLAK